MATPILAISNAGKDPEFDFEPPSSTTTTTTTIIATTTTTSIPTTRSGRTRLLRTLKGSGLGSATSPAIGGSNAANKAGASSSGNTTTTATANSTPPAAATPLSSSLNSSSSSPSTPSSAATPSTNDGGAGGILGCHAHGGSITNRELRCHQCGRRPPCHHQLHSRRMQKIKHRSSASTSSPASIITTPTAASSSFVAAMPATNGDSMDTPVFSYWGSDPVPLPSRFARIKRDLVRGNEAAISASWARLLQALRAETEHIENLGAHLIPSIQYADIQDSTQTQRFAEALKRYGVGVVRGVVPAEDAERAIKDTVQYVVDTDTVKPPPVQDPTCFDFFWTPAQVRMRAHPDVLTAQRFMMSLWETKGSDRLSTKCPVTYADRLRIHGATIGNPASQQPTPRHDGTNGVSAPASADDWLNAIQSSTIIAQVDNGSLERWEPDGYTRAGTYSSIFCGQFEAYDPWAPGGRIATTTDLYNGYGACSIFRMFQGILALSTIEPGMVRLLPSPKLATAYFLLRPFFSPKTPPPEAREGPEWEAFLAPENWQLDKEPNTIIHGAVPGHAQRLTELWHPHLHLRRSLVTLPTLLRGDYILWHPDLPYHINSDTSLRSLNTQSDTDVSMLVYIPAAPLTQTNALYLARQRKAFLRGYPGPDFDSTGSGLGSEAQHSDRPGEAEIAKIGGPDGLRAMGLAPWEVAGTPVGEVDKKDRDDDIEMATGAQTPRGTPNAEDEVIRLGNIIVHPDQCMMGFPGHARKGS